MNRRDRHALLANGPHPPAIVVGLDNITGLQTARILDARGVGVVGIAADLRHFGSRTNACAHVIESPLSGEPLISALLALAEASGEDGGAGAVHRRVGPDPVRTSRRAGGVVPPAAGRPRGREHADGQGLLRRTCARSGAGHPPHRRPEEPRRGRAGGTVHAVPSRPQTTDEERPMAAAHPREGAAGGRARRPARGLRPGAGLVRRPPRPGVGGRR